MKTYLVAAVLAITLLGCGGTRESGHAAPAGAPVKVNLVAAATEEWPLTYEASGTVRARSSATVSAKWMGYIREMKVQIGDHVREGQLLVVLDARDLDAGARRAAAAREEVRSGVPEAESGIEAAKSNFDLAQVTFKRMNELYNKKSISDQEFDEASAKLKAAGAAYDMARAKRVQLDSRLAQAEQEVRASEVTQSYAEMRAPFAGVVTAKLAEPGNLALPGSPLLTIESDGYRLEASVEESKLAAIRTGQPVAVTLDGVPGALALHVSEIVPTVDAAARSYTVKVDLPALRSMRSGIFGRARFQLGTRAVTAVPAAAMIERGQLRSVFVADGGIARTRLITTGESSGGRMEVLSGLTAGEKLVVPVPQNLTDGARIEVRP